MTELKATETRLVPLGGLGEIGMNCLAIEQAGGILIVDCGITFPNDDVGIDIYHPLFSWLEERRERVRGLFITHGHEDHVGAVGHLLTRMDVPVFGPAHSLAIARHRMSEMGLVPKNFRLVNTVPRGTYEVGPFVVEPIRVTHSIAEATALAIRTASGIIIHTGDFKLDPSPPDGELTDEARFKELGDEGVRLLLSDSTNIDARSEPGSESTVGDELDRIVAETEHRVIIGAFASNVQRLIRVGEIAQKYGRKIALLGRSLQLHVGWAHELGHLNWPSDLVVPADQAGKLPRDQILCLAGGTQAEPFSAMRRLASRTHPLLSLEEGDVIVFSSRIIPGNDVGVFAMMGDLLRQGVTLRNWITDPLVHVSGHAHRSEQRRMMEMTRPEAFIPLHGTLHHLMRHADLAREQGIRDVLVLENGEVARLDEESLVKEGRVQAGKVAMSGGRELPWETIRERQFLARGGMVHTTVVVDRRGRLRASPSVVTHGIAIEEAERAAIARAVSEAFEKRPFQVERPGDELIADTARYAARRAVEARAGKRPVALATVLRVEAR